MGNRQEGFSEEVYFLHSFVLYELKDEIFLVMKD